MSETLTLPRELHHDNARQVRVELGAGLIELGPSADDATHVSLDARRDDDESRQLVRESRLAVVGDEIIVDVPRESSRRTAELLLRIAAPVGLDYRIKAGSADITADVQLGEARLVTGSGDVRLTQVAGRLEVRTGSGDVQVDDATTAVAVDTGSGDIDVRAAGGTIGITTGSGDVEIGSARDGIAVSTGSGDVRIGEAGGPAKVKVGSGDITIERVRDHSVATSGTGDIRVEAAHGPSVALESARGDVYVGVPVGTPTYLDLKTVNGDIRCDLEPTEKPAEGTRVLALRARTVSGDITVARI